MGVSGFEHDVFVSYSHVDNLPEREGEKGWVEAFEQQLTVQLLRRVGKGVKLWRDAKLKGGDRFDAVIENAVRNSAVVMRNSPVRWRSRVCGWPSQPALRRSGPTSENGCSSRRMRW